MKTYKQKIEESKLKQKYLDEIHLREDVKPIFVTNEIIGTINIVLICTLFSFGIWAVLNYSLEVFVQYEEILYLLLHSVGGWLVTIFIGLKFLFGRFKKKQAEKLQILEDAGLAEIKKAVEEGTYVEGPQPSKAYLTFRAIRSAISSIIVFAFIGVLFYIAFSRR